MLYLIGLGTSLETINLETLKVMKKCNLVYLENYTAKFPYKIEKLEKIIKKKINLAKREIVEGDELINKAKNKNLALLVYGNPFAATTHISLILSCKKKGVKCRVIENVGIFEAVSETGLQLYKFGKTASLPRWKKSYKPKSFLNIIKDNEKINAHTLILIDPELTLKEAIEQLKQCGIEKNKKIIICEKIGTKKRRIYYDKIEKLKNKKIHHPFCFVFPFKLHFSEEEALEKFKKV